MMPAADQFAPTIVHPRTLKCAKRKACSDCCHVVKMKGGCQGIDSFILCNQGNCGIADLTSIKQDALALAMRPDMISNLNRLVLNRTIPHELGEAKFQLAKQMFPVQKRMKLHENHLNNATFVSFDNAIKHENMMKDESIRCLSIRDTSCQQLRCILLRNS